MSLAFYVSMMLNVTIFILMLHRCWRSIPCVANYLTYLGIVIAYGIFMLGDVDGLLPTIDLRLVGEPSPRALLGKFVILIGLLMAIAWEFRDRKMAAEKIKNGGIV